MHVSGPLFAAQAFGLRWGSDYPLDQFAPAQPGAGPPDVTIARVAHAPSRPGGLPVNNGAVYADGARFRFEDAVFDTFGGARVEWSAPSAPALPAAFYGTVAAIVLAWRGLTPLHGSAVALGGRAVLIAGPSGAGKSTLCDALVRMGGKLVSDDLSALLPLLEDGEPMLLPGRPAIRLAIPGGPARAKRMQASPTVHPDQPVPLSALVVLRSKPIPPGPAEASAMLTGQLFRPGWMRALPGASERVATLFRAAQRLTILTAPTAPGDPDISVDAKATRLLAALRERGAI